MTAEERQHRIEEYLQKVEFASLEELAEKFDASVSTVRRDVTALEGKGTVRRTHGGARLTVPSRSEEFIFSARQTHQLAEKEWIARGCASLIQPNQTVIIDAGSTCFQIARHLEPKTPHIVTNSLPVAQHFSAAHKIEVVVSGGVIYPRLGVLVGPLAIATFRQIHADVAIMSCGGITSDAVTNSHALLIDIQRVMMEAARRIILCVDHTKFGRQSISRLCGLDEIDTIVTNDPPPKDLLRVIELAGTEVIVSTSRGIEVLRHGRTRMRHRSRAGTPPGELPAEPAVSASHHAGGTVSDDDFLD